jgi:hypothetical protein
MRKIFKKNENIRKNNIKILLVVIVTINGI